jgi:FixJ family two-component response regulator
MNGGELREELFRLIPNIPTLFMSGYPTGEISKYGILTDSAHFLQKPFTNATLIQKLKNVLGGRVPSGASS